MTGPSGAHFYQTTDGGDTWASIPAADPTSMSAMDAISIDCVFPTSSEEGNCWANLLDVLTQESSVAVMQPVA